MALWQKTQQLPQHVLQQIRNGIYGEHFPIEVRHYLAYWIDEQSWSSVDPDFPQCEHHIKELMSAFVREIEIKANSFLGQELFLYKFKLLEVANEFKKMCESDPVALYRTIRHCVMSEMKLIEEHEYRPNSHMMEFRTSYHNKIDQELESLKQEIKENDEMIKQLDAKQQCCSIDYYKFQKLSESNMRNQALHIQDREQFFNKFNNLEFNIHETLKHVDRLKCMIIEKIETNILCINSLLDRILGKELIDWKRNQQLAGNGAEFNANHLEVLQNWCQKLSQNMWDTLTQIKAIKNLVTLIVKMYPPNIAHFNSGFLDLQKQQVSGMLSRMINDTFIVEKQPPQVMKTNTRFSATVRHLVGGVLHAHMNPPQVKVSIITEAQANHLLTEKTVKGEITGEILNNTGTMEYSQTTNQLSVSFRNMQLKKIKRAEKKGTESVVDEKFALYFSSKISIGGEPDFEVWTLSLPVTVIVHGNQEPHAWATIIWDNAFAEPDRKPFVTPEKVYWGKLANALNLKFKHRTGRGLSNDNLRYLAEKLFKVHSDEYETVQCSWSQFSKESLAERNFAFWDWFYAIMKLTREYLKPLWEKDLIMGFVRKKQAENLLSACQNGTFLLRFSDSELGGITIAWVAGTSEQKEVSMLQPFTAKDFAIRSLADRLNDLDELRYLFPNILKEQAFSSYYTSMGNKQSAGNNGGYVIPFLKTHLGLEKRPNNQNTFGSGSLSSTPPTNIFENSPSLLEPRYESDFGGRNDMACDCDIFNEDFNFNVN